ncbi:MAG: hypothetical protein IKP72_07870, partial [Clostridia bacterium]|nr:hypothetical protein [Clostridia bacterium]
RNWRNNVVGNINGLRLPRWGYGKFEGFWPKKAWKNPRGKVNFPLRIFPGFPRMQSIRAGGFAAGPEA